MAIEPSSEVQMPPPRYSSNMPGSSSCLKSDSLRYWPISSTTTEEPARWSSAAITPPPAPEPTTHTSACSVAVGPSSCSTAIVFGACSGEGGGESGPG
jgi:hypothetical protein